MRVFLSTAYDLDRNERSQCCRYNLPACKRRHMDITVPQPLKASYLLRIGVPYTYSSPLVLYHLQTMTDNSQHQEHEETNQVKSGNMEYFRTTKTCLSSVNFRRDTTQSCIYFSTLRSTPFVVISG